MATSNGVTTIKIDSVPTYVPIEGQICCIIKDYRYKFTAGELAGTISTRNRCMSFITIKGVVPGEASDLDIHIDQQTGVCLLSYILNGAINALRSFDYGKTFTDPVEVTNAAGISKPCSFVDNTTQHKWWMCWNENDSIKLAYSSNSFQSKTEDVWMSGAKNLRPVINKLTGVMLATGWRSDNGGEIVAWRSIDNGANFTGPYVVCAAPEQSFGLTDTPSSRNTWCIVCFDASNNIKTYWSHDDGLTCALATA
jgi:hypothetical protein